jgi:DNA-binding response OmpR family regulator
MKPKLLIVEDDQAVRESLRKVLEAEDYEVFPARDGREAMEHFSAQRIDLVVLDINLGVENGWQVFEAMTTTNPFVPTIVITAEWGQREQAGALGVEGLVEKPIKVAEFLNLIRDLLAETTEARLKRICGNDDYCHYVGRRYEPHQEALQRRRVAPPKPRTRSESLAEASPAAQAESQAPQPGSSPALPNPVAPVLIPRSRPGAALGPPRR